MIFIIWNCCSNSVILNSNPVVLFNKKPERELIIKDGNQSAASILRNNSFLPSVSFSPESGGRVKPRRAMLEMRTQGTIRLKK